jgi:hypothetical protein
MISKKIAMKSPEKSRFGKLVAARGLFTRSPRQEDECGGGRNHQLRFGRWFRSEPEKTLMLKRCA